MADNNDIRFNFTANVQGALEAFTGINQGLELIEKTIGYVKEAYEALVVPTMEYARAVRETSQALGLSTLETSRLIQVADDYNITQEQLTTALEMAVKKGYQPSIDNLAKLSDELGGMASPLDKAEKLSGIFGRNWATLVPMLNEGGQALRDAANEADALGLTIDSSTSAAVRSLEIAMDNLEDKQQAINLQIGSELVPFLVLLAETVSGDVVPNVRELVKSVIDAYLAYVNWHRALLGLELVIRQLENA